MELKNYNFFPGPSIIPREAMDNAIKMLEQHQKSGISFIEKSHRTDDYLAVLAECKKLVAQLLNLKECSKKFHILFLSGGASQEFVRLPINLLEKNQKAFYLDSGFWTKKAFEEGRLALKMRGFDEKVLEKINSSYSENHLENFSFIPPSPPNDLQGKYLYLCTNNTIVGTQYHTLPKSNLPLVGDATSDLFAINRDPKELDKFGMIFSSTQKNIGTPGICLALICEEFMEELIEKQKKSPLPKTLCYAEAHKQDSLINTPPTFTMYMLHQVLLWMKTKGGVSALAKKNQQKSEMLYQLIDESELLEGHSKKEDRSIVNVVFRFSNKWNKAKEWEKSFLEKCQKECILGINGHRLLGGMRASMYNAFPLEDTLKFLDILNDFISSIKRQL